MKVYTHYKDIAEYNVGYRWRTLLQFGTSWDVIGSVVMINPGSANYKYGKDCWIQDKDVLSHLESFDYSEDKGEKWFEFKPDQTMGCVAELFSLYKRVPKPDHLHGVIQIFNLFYLREPNLGKAIKENKELLIFKQINDGLLESDLNALKPPIYLGFGRLAQSPDFREKAMLYLKEATEKHHQHYLDADFDKNTFAHPRSLMRFRRYTKESVQLRMQFCTNSLSSKEIGEQNPIES